jgi:hypothetical protein
VGQMTILSLRERLEVRMTVRGTRLTSQDVK